MTSWAIPKGELTEFQVGFLLAFYQRATGECVPPKDIEEAKRRGEAEQRRRALRPLYCCGE